MLPDVVFLVNKDNQYLIAAVFKLGSAVQRGSVAGSQGVRERIPQNCHCHRDAMQAKQKRLHYFVANIFRIEHTKFYQNHASLVEARINTF